MVAFGYDQKTVTVAPVGMVHINQPGQPVMSKYEISVSGMTPAQSGIMFDAIESTMAETAKNMNDPDRESDMVNGSVPTIR